MRPGGLVAGERVQLVVPGGGRGRGQRGCPKPDLLGIGLPGETKALEVSPPEDSGGLPPVCGKTIAVSDWVAE